MKHATPGGSLAEDREKALALLRVSRETLERLDRFVTVLIRWQSTHNLISAATLLSIWTRHVADSLQLLQHAPTEGGWLDFGAGGGFPGVVVAIARTTAGHGPTFLVEANAKKCAFLRTALRETEADAQVFHGRIEDVAATWEPPLSVVSARAVAPLSHLMRLCAPLLKTGGIALFPKGQDVDAELTEASKSWIFTANKLPSITDPDGCILRLHRLAARSAAASANGEGVDDLTRY